MRSLRSGNEDAKPNPSQEAEDAAPPKRKRGRKAMPDANERRKVSNRSAQKRFREKKTEHFRDIESRASDAKENLTKAYEIMQEVCGENMAWAKLANQAHLTLSLEDRIKGTCLEKALATLWAEGGSSLEPDPLEAPSSETSMPEGLLLAEDSLFAPTSMDMPYMQSSSLCRSPSLSSSRPSTGSCTDLVAPSSPYTSFDPQYAAQPDPTLATGQFMHSPLFPPARQAYPESEYPQSFMTTGDNQTIDWANYPFNEASRFGSLHLPERRHTISIPSYPRDDSIRGYPSFAEGYAQ